MRAVPRSYAKVLIRAIYGWNIEAISKFRIRFEGKAQGGEKAEHTRSM
jgi:hypothetical protein